MLRTLSLTCAAFLFIALNSATAAPVTFTFSGNVTQVPLDEVFGNIAFGDSFNGTVIFDTSATDLIPADPATGSYSFGAPFGMTVNLDGHTFDASGFLNISILNSFVDQYSVLATSSAGDLTLELFLQDNTGAAFNSDQLPPSLPPLTDFAQKDFHLDLISSAGEVQVDGQLAAATVAPEPGPACLALTGALLLFFLPMGKRLLTK